MKTFFVFLILTSLISCGKKSSSTKPQKEVREDEVVDDLSSFEKDYMKLLNNYRSSLGLKKLKYVKVIEEVALEHSTYMASGFGRFGHRGWKKRCQQLMNELQGTQCGEIVAMGQKTPQDVLYAWIQSPSHRKSIEHPDFTHTGLGIRKNKKGLIYWTEIFIQKR
jgi:uncharacterized protein YkwD